MNYFFGVRFKKYKSRAHLTSEEKKPECPISPACSLGMGCFFLVSSGGFHKEGQSMSDAQLSMAEHTHLPLQEHTTAGASMKKLLFKDGQSGACAAGQYYLRARPVSLRSRSCAHQARVSRAGPSCSRASPAPTIFVQVILCVRPVIVISVNILKQLGVNSQAYLVSRYDQLNIDHFGHTHKSTEQDKITNFRKPLPSWKNTTTNISKEACTCISTIGECIVSGWIRDAQLSNPISHRMLWSRPWHCCLILNPHPCPSLLDLNIRLQSAMRCICICICIWARNSSTP